MNRKGCGCSCGRSGVHRLGQQLLQLQQELSSAGRKTGRDRVAPVAHLSAKAAEVRQQTTWSEGKSVGRQIAMYLPLRLQIATREAPKTIMMGLGAPESDDETSNNPNHCSSRSGYGINGREREQRPQEVETADVGWRSDTRILATLQSGGILCDAGENMRATPPRPGFSHSAACACSRRIKSYSKE